MVGIWTLRIGDKDQGLEFAIMIGNYYDRDQGLGLRLRIGGWNLEIGICDWRLELGIGIGIKRSEFVFGYQDWRVGLWIANLGQALESKWELELKFGYRLKITI